MGAVVSPKIFQFLFQNTFIMRSIIYCLAGIFFLTQSCARKTQTAGYSWSPPVQEIRDTNVVLPPAWAFGVLYGGYTNQHETIKTIEEIQKHDYPIDAYWIDSWFWSYADKGVGPHKYIDFIADTTDYPDRKAMWDFMEKNHIKGGFWIWDCIQKHGNEQVFADFKKRGFFRDVYLNTNPWHNKSTSTAMHQEGGAEAGTPTGNINFDSPEAVAYFKMKMKHFFDEGADFIKLDRTTHLATCRTMFEMSQEFGKETKGRGFMLSHMVGIENEEYKRYPTKWTSDTRSDWTIERPLKDFNSWVPAVAFKENIELYTNIEKKSSEIPFLTNDTGGFDMGITDELDEELYIRWMQFSIFTPVTSVFSQPENPTGNLAWRYSERADTLFRFYSHLRMKLFPYLYSYAHGHRIWGIHMLRKLPGQWDSYLLGEELLVAPVYQQGATTREVFFPEGDWVDFWTGEHYKGGSRCQVMAPIDRIPLFVRKGAIIPMRDYTSSIEQGSNDRLYLHLYQGENCSFKLIEDDGISNDYLEGKFALTEMEMKNEDGKIMVNIFPVKGYYEGMPLTRQLKLIFPHSEKPQKVLLNSKETRFSYSEDEKQIVLETKEVSKREPLVFEIIMAE